MEEIEEISVKAEKEFSLEKMLEDMKNEWKEYAFEVKAYKETGTFVIGGTEDIATLLDDHIVKTQTMRGSPFIKPIEKICKGWEKQLQYSQAKLFLVFVFVFVGMF